MGLRCPVVFYDCGDACPGRSLPVAPGFHFIPSGLRLLNSNSIFSRKQTAVTTGAHPIKMIKS